MKKAAIYLRVSTEEQKEKQTIASQCNFSERYFAANPILVYSCYADDGISGIIPLEQRPEGARLLADARTGKIDTVFVYRLDRLGRDTILSSHPPLAPHSYTASREGSARPGLPIPRRPLARKRGRSRRCFSLV
jgi:Resolvase, N terminal domain